MSERASAGTIGHISDTARWVAYYRAMETQRKDAIFRDPFADRLAGPQGAAIVARLKHGRSFAWPMIVRTAVFDEMILTRVEQHGVDLVLNLAAGLDARPWRLQLPPQLRWVDVDLPDMLEYKANQMKAERTRCHYEAIATDLTQPDALVRLVDRIGPTARRALVITEGLLVYLTPEAVGALARGLGAAASMRWWLTDLASPRLLVYLQRRWGKALEDGNAPMRFGPAEGTRFFEPFGWREVEFRSTGVEARRLGRAPRSMAFWGLISRFSPPAKQEEFRRMAGYVLLERGAATT